MAKATQPNPKKKAMKKTVESLAMKKTVESLPQPKKRGNYLKKDTLEVTKSMDGDTTWTKHPKRTTKDGMTSQLTEIKIKKRKPKVK
jgi:hypothetical protein